MLFVRSMHEGLRFSPGKLEGYRVSRDNGESKRSRTENMKWETGMI